MSKADILAELPRLTAEDRGEILESLYGLEESILREPSAVEKSLLDAELADYDTGSDRARPWADVESRLRNAR